MFVKREEKDASFYFLQIQILKVWHANVFSPFEYDICSFPQILHKFLKDGGKKKDKKKRNPIHF